MIEIEERESEFIRNRVNPIKFIFTPIMGNVKSCCARYCGCCLCCNNNNGKKRRQSENIGLHPMARALVDDRRSHSSEDGVDEVGECSESKGE